MFGRSLSRRNLLSNGLCLFIALAMTGVLTSKGTLAATPAADDDQTRHVSCPLLNKTLRGTYISLHPTGFIVGVGPITANGTITFDGKGNSSNTFTASINGVIQRGVTVVGPYVVNPDCTGTLSQSDGSNYDMVVLPDGSRFSWIETDSGTVLSGEAVRFKND